MRFNMKKVVLPFLVIALACSWFVFDSRFNPKKETIFQCRMPTLQSEEPVVHRIEGLMEYVSIPELFQDASLIVEGTITGHTNAFQIENFSGAVKNFTDYQIHITSVLRGALEDGVDSVEIRIEGGTVGNYTEEYSGSPKFEIGKEYLVFLYQPGRGGAFNTEGDYYYVLGLCQGVFAKDENEQYLSQSGEKLTDDYLIQPINDVPVDPDHFRNEYIEHQKVNLENGFLTQEEFDQLMRDIDKYAKIVS